MANQIIRNISVLSDLSCVAQPIEYVQCTNAISILFHLVDYTIPAGSMARVYVEWPSAKGEYDNAVIEQNSIHVKVKDTMFSEVGKCFLQLCIVNGEDTLVTFKYPVVVKENKVPGITKPSKNQSDFLDKYLSEIDNKIEITTQQVKDTAQAKEDALTYAGNSEQSAQNAAKSEVNALQHSKDSLASANAAKGSEDKSLEHSNAAATSADNAEKSNVASKQNADNSALSAAQSTQSEENARVYAESAKADAEQINSRIDLVVESAESAEQSAQNAAAKSAVADEKANLAEQYALMAESFTHGGTGIRENEAVDNAQYFLEQAKQVSQSMNGLIPMGTITFEDLSLEENQVNKYMFNISNDFVTDDTFKEGAGHSYPAGVNVFRTNDGYWDCLAGSFQTPNGDTKDNTIAFVPASTRANIQSGEKHSIIFGKIAKWFADLKTVAFTGSYNDLSDKPSASDVGAVATGGDVAENTVSYSEAETLTELASGEKLKVSFGKLKQAVKNVISILKLLGNTDISKIGDGTVTGILSALNTDMLSAKNTTNAHIANKSNPHGVTKTQVGLGNVDNTADSAKSVKYANSAGSSTTANSATNDSGGYHIHNTFDQILNKFNSYMPLTGGIVNGSLSIADGYMFGTRGGTQDFIIWNGSLGVVTRASAGIHAQNASGSGYVNIAASGFQQVSSKKTKDNIIDITKEEAQKLLDIKVVSFDYKEEFGGHKNNFGVIAEEVNTIIPYAVTIPDGYIEEDFDEKQGINQPIPSVDYSKFVPYLIKMVQIQETRINELEKTYK